jgi:hypothetical protein
MSEVRPRGSNADEWHLFLCRRLDNRATHPSGLEFVAVQIAEAIEAERDRCAKIAEPRDTQNLMRADWQWILRALTMTRDRARSGTPLHITRPAWLQPQADTVALMRDGVKAMINDIFATAVVDEPDL